MKEIGKTANGVGGGTVPLFFFTGGFVLEHASDYETTLHCATPVTGAVSVHNNPVLQSENQNTGHRCSLSTEVVRAKTSAFISEVFVRELQASPLGTALTD
jgi:hypothetical protein